MPECVTFEGTAAGLAVCLEFGNWCLGEGWTTLTEINGTVVRREFLNVRRNGVGEREQPHRHGRSFVRGAGNNADFGRRVWV